LTTIARLKSTALTGGLGNPVIATLEWVGALTTSLVAILIPLLALAVLVALLISAGRIRRMLRGAAKESL
jgi:hypothetical protein